MFDIAAIVCSVSHHRFYLFSIATHCCLDKYSWLACFDALKMPCPPRVRRLRATDLQNILQHIFCGKRRPSYIRFKQKPTMAILGHLPLYTTPNSGFDVAAAISLDNCIDIPTFLANMDVDLSVTRLDLSVVTPEALEMIEKQDIRSLFKHMLFANNDAAEERLRHDKLGDLDPEQIEKAFNTLFSSFVRPYRVTEYFLVAVDCEMVKTASGFVLGRVTLLDCRGNVLYDRYIKPNERVIDYLTEYSGLSPQILEKGISMKRAQTEILEYIGTNTYVLGHGLEHDLGILEIYTEKLIDTAYLYQTADGYKIKLCQLSRTILQEKIQDGSHSSREDALCCLKLLAIRVSQLSRLRNGHEKRLDLGAQVIRTESVPTDLSKNIYLTILNEETIKADNFQQMLKDDRILICIFFELNGVTHFFSSKGFIGSKK